MATDDERARRLKAALIGLGVVGRKIERHASEAPTTFEAVTRQQVEDLADAVGELRKMLLGVFASVIVAGIVALVLGALR